MTLELTKRYFDSLQDLIDEWYLAKITSYLNNGPEYWYWMGIAQGYANMIEWGMTEGEKPWNMEPSEESVKKQYLELKKSR